MVLATIPRRESKGVLVFPSQAGVGAGATSNVTPLRSQQSQSRSVSSDPKQHQENQPKRRAVSRQYSAAKHSRLTSDWNASGTSADAEVYSALRTLRYRSRDLMRNDNYFKRGKSLFVNNVVFRGIRLQGQIPKLRGKGYDDVLNSQVESLWKYWCKKRYCHTGGTLTFNAMQRLIAASFIESGEVLIRFHNQSFGGSKIPLGIEVIESDRLDDSQNGVSSAGNQIRMGVEVDGWGRPVAYYILPQHPGDYLFDRTSRSRNSPERVPAESIIHLYCPDRPGQTRGVPFFASAMIKSRHLSLYEEGEVIASRVQSLIAAFITGNDPDLVETDSDGTRIESLEPGAIRYLAPGETFQGFEPTRPGGQFEPFVRTVLRSMAAGMDISYAGLSQDYSDSNFSSSRLSLLEDRGVWMVFQDWFIENLLQPIYEKWLESCYFSNLITLPGYLDEMTKQRFYIIKWQTRGWHYIDPLKEANAAVVAINNSISTVTEELNAQGLDLEETLKTRRRELDLANEIGVDITPMAARPRPPSPSSGGQSPSSQPEKGRTLVYA